MRHSTNSFPSDLNASIEGRTVLIVDDDRITRNVLEKMLLDDGYKVEQADHGEKCLFLSLQKRIDAFLLDVRMPGMSGVEVCRRLRSMERYRLTPIIIVTAADDSTQIREVFEAGADDYIVKPVKSVTLKARLKGHLQKMDYFLEMERVRENLNRYISTRTQSMVEAYSVTGSLPTPEQVDVCVMFTDVRGYTALSQTLEPTTLFYKLSRHLGMQVDCVYRHGGYIDKFGGDGIMAVFDSPDRASKACHCALEIIGLTKMDQVAVDTPVMELGIGVHMGPVLIGNIGSEDHLDYSAIGATVNLAARLCGCADPMSIVVSEAVSDSAAGDSRLHLTKRRQVNIRGIRQPVVVCDVELDLNQPSHEWSAMFGRIYEEPRLPKKA